MRLVLTLPVGEVLTTGKQVTFEAPCGSEGLNEISVNGVTYDLVDAEGNSLVANSFNAEAMVSVIFNVEKKKAFIQNADTNAYLEDRLSQAYVKEATGEIIGISDSANAPVHSLSVCGKTTQITTVGNQLVDFSKGSPTSGVTYSFENDILTVIGDGKSTYQHVQFIVLDIIKNNAGKSIYFSFEDLTYERESRVFCQIVLTKTDDTKIYSSLINSNGAQVAYPIPNDVSDIVSAWIGVYVNNSAELFTNTVTIVKPMLQFSTAKLTYEPYSGGKASPCPEFPQELVNLGADSGSISVKVCGKNLLVNTATTQTVNGITFTVNSDGSVSVKGTATTKTYFRLNSNLPLVKGNYVISGCPTDGDIKGFYLYFQTSEVTKYDHGFDEDVQISLSNDTSAIIGICIYGSAEIDVVFYPMIRHASITDNTYVPYEGYGLNDITTYGGLPGIPVASGGNYTDRNGQQWICDEIDYERGVYIQRIKDAVNGVNTTLIRHTYTNDDYFVAYIQGSGKALVADVISSHFMRTRDHNLLKSRAAVLVMVTSAQSPVHLSVPTTIATDTSTLKAWLLDNDVHIYYALDEPVETPIPESELFMYRNLTYTYNPNTTIFSDEGAYIKLQYYTPKSVLPESGGKMSGAIDMWGNYIHNVGYPYKDGDAINLSFLKEYTPYSESPEYPGCFYRLVDPSDTTPAPEDYEWVNPPMIAGEEYRTTERYGDKVVYTKSIWFEELAPNKGTLTLFPSLEEPINVIYVQGFVNHILGKARYPFPVINQATGLIDAAIVSSNYDNIFIQTYAEDVTQYGWGEVVVKYTKIES